MIKCLIIDNEYFLKYIFYNIHRLDITIVSKYIIELKTF